MLSCYSRECDWHAISNGIHMGYNYFLHYTEEITKAWRHCTSFQSHRVISGSGQNSQGLRSESNTLNLYKKENGMCINDYNKWESTPKRWCQMVNELMQQQERKKIMNIF